MTGSARLAPVGIRIVAVGADNLNIYICAELNQWLNECANLNLHVHVLQVRGDQSSGSHRARFTCLAMNSDALASPLFQASYSKRASVKRSPWKTWRFLAYAIRNVRSCGRARSGATEEARLTIPEQERGYKQVTRLVT